MTKERAKELLPIITAFAEGKTIQATHGEDWKDIDCPNWEATGARWRVKPEPRVWWVNVPKGEAFRSEITNAYSDQVTASNYCPHDYKPIKVQEVL